MSFFQKSILISLILFISISLKTVAQTSAPAFAKGADIGWLSEMEASGYKFKNDNGVEEDCMDILKAHGINSLRFRVWVNPAKGYCGKNDVIKMAKRAKDKGFRIMIDFHYSDWWADPAKQTIPAAWANDNIDQMVKHVYDHTFDVLDSLKKTGIIPEWVQVGNETNNGMLWPMGKASTSMKNYALLTQSGYNAVKAVDSAMQVIVHVSNGHKNSTFRWIFDGLKSNGTKWDIIGMSLYPSWAGVPWETANIQCLANMKDMISRYGTQVMICEVGMEKTQADACKSFLIDIQAKNYSVGGQGVFYWEPQSYNWEGYNLGAWDYVTKAPTVAMDAFLIDPANPPKPTRNVTFKVSLKGSGKSTTNGVYILGSQTSWAFTPMTLEADSLYSVTLKLVEGSSATYYFVTSNSWDTYKSLREPSIPNSCGDSTIVGWAGDRLLIIPSKDTIVSYAWGTCAKPTITGIKNNNVIENNIWIYPNPAKVTLHLNLQEEASSSTFVEIYEISGQIVKKIQLKKNVKQSTINISDLNSGVYIIKLLQNNKILKYDKLIIE